MNTRILGLALTTVIAVGVAGCGGDDSSTSSTTTATALTQEEFLAQGNAICAAGNKEIDAAAQSTFSGGQPTAAEGEQFATETLIPSIQGQIDDLGALVPPADEADQVTSLLADAQSALDEVKADPTLALQGNQFADVNKQATEIGLDSCAG